jgi:hypothetical protein
MDYKTKYLKYKKKYLELKYHGGAWPNMFGKSKKQKKEKEKEQQKRKEQEAEKKKILDNGKIWEARNKFLNGTIISYNTIFDNDSKKTKYYVSSMVDQDKVNKIETEINELENNKGIKEIKEKIKEMEDIIFDHNLKMDELRRKKERLNKGLLSEEQENEVIYSEMREYLKLSCNWKGNDSSSMNQRYSSMISGKFTKINDDECQ